MIDLELTPDQILLIETVRSYMDREFAPHIQEWDAQHAYQPDTFAKLAEIGLTGICFPDEYGGSGMDYISLGLASEELEYVDTSFARYFRCTSVSAPWVSMSGARKRRSSDCYGRWLRASGLGRSV